MGIFDAFKKKNKITEQQATDNNAYLDEYTYIVRFEHTEARGWHQYTIQLTSGYNWGYMLSSADYLIATDIVDLQQVEYSLVAGAPGVNITSNFKTSKTKLQDYPELQNERGVLSIAGTSRNARIPLKIIWFNQTSIMRFITPGINNEELIRKYAESVIRRNFGTPDAMRMGKPLPN